MSKNSALDESAAWCIEGYGLPPLAVHVRSLVGYLLQPVSIWGSVDKVICSGGGSPRWMHCLLPTKKCFCCFHIAIHDRLDLVEAWYPGLMVC